MSMPTGAILDQIVSHTAASGYFVRVNQHEPKVVPNDGLTAAVWVQNVRPVQSSGLARTSGRIEFRVRIYSSMEQEPQDAIDPRVLDATDALIAAYSGDFELGGNVRHVDLLGSEGTALQAEAGYINQQGAQLRVMDITLPVIVNDIWEQVA